MEYLMAGLTPLAFVAALLITFFAGFVKGAIGFAMPMIMISAFSSFLPPETALAGLILPTLISNLTQAFRHGPGPVWATTITYRRMLISMVIFIVISAQFVRIIPQDLFLLLLGLPITIFAALQLAGVGLALRLEHRSRAEWMLGIISGLYGGLSGVWGPPVLVYLLSIKADKLETVRVQGVVFLIGAVVLLVAHLHSGVLTASTTAFSAVLVLPAMLGQSLGVAVQDRLDQSKFRRWTQILLVLTGLNLMRRAVGL
ncbi:MAG: sulfite exporter TauE/SafE family protein [Cypionkella sp.]|uniref:sulfite exporter TauE/SafE family protein n=1 Tax=Cypionkella sp. TaxID=2811411 RepID=UPI002AB800B0|nr:sulfite exporter TauE/SafE family protein [Cypionkella sp.]MDZ4311042.1 sulfite exporter TauE/SafE family protein [Cypionkella sp.]